MPLTPDQRKLVRVVTAIISEQGFALAGAGALMEHNLVDRVTADVDLFTNIVQDIGATAAGLAERLVADDFDVVITRSTPYFARLEIDSLDVDLAHNWRADPPGRVDIGPILSIRDAIAGKIEALFTRIEPRDVMDVAQLFDFYPVLSLCEPRMD